LSSQKVSEQSIYSETLGQVLNKGEENRSLLLFAILPWLRRGNKSLDQSSELDSVLLTVFFCVPRKTKNHSAANDIISRPDKGQRFLPIARFSSGLPLHRLPSFSEAYTRYASFPRAFTAIDRSFLRRATLYAKMKICRNSLRSRAF
jgi:hypothetical protein